MGIGSKLKQLLNEEVVDSLRQQVKDVAEQGLDRHLRIAVTGLSRSGKTVFITALTQHLLSEHRQQALPFFEAAASGRIVSVKDISHTAEAAFPLATARDQLSATSPQWPPSTTGLSEVRLAIRYRPASRLQRILQDTATLYLDIIDYPGEWLLDLPLLDMSFEQWCQQQTQLIQHEPRHTSASDWCAAQQGIDWQASANDSTLTALSDAYSALLNDWREAPFSLSLLQPGRCLLPGDLAGDPVLTLFPIITGLPAEPPVEGSYYAVLKQHYETYQHQVVKRFYREHFARFDRQVVLVDCLKTLNQGEACFNDMKQSLTAILQSFNYGQSGFLRRLFSPRIDKVLFACTKADHVTANQHHNLDKFLELIILDAQRHIRFEGVSTQCLALSSIRSTQAAEAKLDGQMISCLKGVQKSTGQTIALFPGEVPTELPSPADWNSARFQFLDFAPARLPSHGLTSEHHIRLDQALEFLCGDLF